MDWVAYRDKLIERDAQSLDDRVRRAKRIVPQTTGLGTPDLHWTYSTQLTDLFVSGKFLPAIVYAGIVVEIILRDQLGKADRPPREKAGLGELIRDAGKHLSTIDSTDVAVLREIASARNTIAHAVTGGRGNFAFELHTFMEDDAFRAMEIARQLGQHYYGVAD